MEVAVKSIEFPTPTTPSKTALPGSSPSAGPPQLSRYTVVHIKQDGKWLMASVREASVELPSNFARVEGLDWLVGTWKAERDGTAMHTTVRWIANKSFLEREYTVRKDGIAMSSGQADHRLGSEGRADPLLVVRCRRRTRHGTLDCHARRLADRIVRRAARRHADFVARSADSRSGRRQRARLAIGGADARAGLRCPIRPRSCSIALRRRSRPETDLRRRAHQPMTSR